MKVTVAFLALLVGVVVGQWARPIADQDFLDRQHAIYKLLTRPQQAIQDAELREIADTYNPTRYSSYYNVPEQRIQQYVQQVEQGQILRRGVAFNVLEESHRREMVTLFQMLHQAKDWETFHKTAAWARQRVNEYMFVYAYTTALLHRADSQDFKIPPTYEVLPGNYFGPEALSQAYGAAGAGQNGVVVPTSFAYKYYNPEQRFVAYHSDDVGLGQLHDIFHKQFPFWNCQSQERQGELFYHFIQQTLARYNQARLSSNLPFVQSFGYDPRDFSSIGQSYSTGYYSQNQGFTTPFEKLELLQQLQQQQGLETDIEKEQLLERLQQEGIINTIEKEELRQQINQQRGSLYTIEKLAYLQKLQQEGKISSIEKEEAQQQYQQQLDQQQDIDGSVQKEQIVRKVLQQQGAISPIAKVEVLGRLQQQGAINSIEKNELLQQVQSQEQERQQGYVSPVDQEQLLQQLQRQGVIGPVEKAQIQQQLQLQQQGLNGYFSASDNDNRRKQQQAYYTIQKLAYLQKLQEEGVIGSNQKEEVQQQYQQQLDQQQQQQGFGGSIQKEQIVRKVLRQQGAINPIAKAEVLERLQQQGAINSVEKASLLQQVQGQEQEREQQGYASPVDQAQILQQLERQGVIGPVEKTEIQQQLQQQQQQGYGSYNGYYRYTTEGEVPQQQAYYTIQKLAYLQKLQQKGVIGSFQKEEVQQQYQQQLQDQLRQQGVGSFVQKEQIVSKVVQQQGAISPKAKAEVVERLQQQGAISRVEEVQLLQKVQSQEQEREQQGYVSPVDQAQILQQLERQSLIGSVEKVQIQQQLQQQQRPKGFFFPSSGNEERFQQTYQQQQQVFYTIQKLAYLQKLQREGVIGPVQKEKAQQQYQQQLDQQQQQQGLGDSVEKEQIVSKVVQQQGAISPVAKIQVLERLQQQGAINPAEKAALLQQVQRQEQERDEGYVSRGDLAELVQQLERQGVIGPVEKYQIQKQLQRQQNEGFSSYYGSSSRYPAGREQAYQQQQVLYTIQKLAYLQKLQQEGKISSIEKEAAQQQYQQQLQEQQQQGLAGSVQKEQIVRQVVQQQGAISPVAKIQVLESLQQQGAISSPEKVELMEQAQRQEQEREQQGYVSPVDQDQLLQQLQRQGVIGPVQKVQIQQQLQQQQQGQNGYFSASDNDNRRLQQQTYYTIQKLAYLQKLQEEGVIGSNQKEEAQQQYQQQLDQQQQQQGFGGSVQKEQIVRKVLQQQGAINPIAKAEVLERLQQQGAINSIEKASLLQQVQRQEQEREQQGYVSPVDQTQLLQQLERQGVIGPVQKTEIQQQLQQQQGYGSYTRYPAEEVQQIQQWERRIQEAIDSGYARDVYGQSVYFDQTRGMDVLGKMVQACENSPNPSYYGSLRNALYATSDAQQQQQQARGFQSFVREPAYYRIAELINQLGQRYQNQQTPYTREELEFPGVEVETVEVVGEQEATRNVLTTYMDKFNVDLANTVPAEDNVISPVQQLETQRLRHKSFQYVIKVRSTAAKKAFVRIFLAPVYDHYGAEIPLSQQRQHYVELDKFITEIQQGETVIRRSSKDSSLTVPESQGFKQLIEEVVAAKQGKAVFYVQENQPRCGIPSSILLPRGTPEGIKFNLLVMVTDAEKEIVEHYKHQYLNQPIYKQQYQQQARFYQQQQQEKDVVVSASEEHYIPTYAQCGLVDGTYPFARSMGYPFDRPIRQYVKSAFQTQNMKFVDVVVKHIETAY